ncbi:MAG: leucine--tRNA ligase [Myxococcales bacterium]|nr:leucine--tRNA ligase [Myxococcales bacterium]USN50932.1 MAG: leucine--tRNA ligase [Myxococcales bacterium]
MRYQPKLIENKWQKEWENNSLFITPRDLDELKKKPKYFALDMFPYPSGAGLHVGHPEGYTATDVVARYKRMKGFNVLHAMGWDAFGLPAERAAMRDGIHPAVITKRNIDNFRAQIKRLGFFYDWSREISTTDETYYKWTQWIFLKLYHKGLAYLADVNVNWCPALKTVLANEEVKDGKYVETGDLVERRLMRQWMLKITAYAEQLLTDLDDVDWPESVKEMQRNWIGKSEGAEISFTVDNSSDSLKVFTTRPDTIFGVTFIALAPEHSLAKTLLDEKQKEAGLKYIDDAQKKDDAERTNANKSKSGVFTGSYAVHPLSKKKLPIYIADYVLANYGSGAVMGVPSDDERDQEFALQYAIEIIQVIEQDRMINSDFLDGLTPQTAGKKAIEALEEGGYGTKKVSYKLRDWLFSRQRYWGEPFPIAYDSNMQPFALREDELPVTLPQIDEYRPTDDGRPPLARADDSWRTISLPNGEKAQREVNTMPQWAGSCWYYLRYIDPQNDRAPFDKDLENYWMPVDLYIGGVEHAVLHLLYARFWHKVLFDCGLVHTKEPFQKLFNQGMILAQSYQDENGKYYHPSEVEEKNGAFYTKESGLLLKTQIEKMSKSRSNVVNPDDVIQQYGADSMRLYELFMGPLEQVKPWQMNGVEGVHRFLHRVWRLAVNEESNELSSVLHFGEESPELLSELHKTIQKVEQDIEELRFNTAIAQMMTFVNVATASEKIACSTLIQFLHLLSPFAPHICDEIFSRLGQKGFLLASSWPVFNKDLLIEDAIKLVAQVNGKVRNILPISKGLSKEEVEKLVLNDSEVQRFIDGKEIVKIVVVPDRLVNVVVK